MLMSIINKIRRLMNGSYKLAIKDGMQAGRGVSVMGNVNFGSEPYLITIGDYVRISSGVSFITHDGGTWAFRDLPEYQDVVKYGKIKVGEKTFIGAHAIIMPGVTIGERCIIGAGAVVTKDIPDGCVAVGVPAKVVKTTLEYAENCKRQMVIEDSELYYKDKRAYLEKYL